ncbi:Transmembrane_domain-containing protein [Hexamita inflata]|uniref:Transmembrane domain-containing protein n=1 Tax=Hexamita inflata TaxID=28002 RepID=A0AA86RGH2_9EUKA|nr:Transmembrane domain-containing protein [Hexamita inflata]
MWKQGLISYIGPSQYKVYSLLQTTVDTLSQKIALIRQAKQNNTDNIMTLIVKWCYQSYPRQFIYIFAPPQVDKRFLCSLCNQMYTRHLRMKPCEHLICESCINQQWWEKIKCPVCEETLTDIDVDPLIIKSMLSTPVKCLNDQEKEMEVAMQSSVECTRKNNILYLPDEIFALKDRFNRNEIPIQTLNFMRKEQLQNKNEEILEQITGLNYKILFYQHTTQEKHINIPPCMEQTPYKNFQTHQKECVHCLKQCIHCHQQFPNIAIQMHQLTCPEQVVACPVCYKTELKVTQYNQHVMNCLLKMEELEKHQADLPKECLIDVDLDLKMQNLDKRVQELINTVMKWDTLLQNEVISYMKGIKGTSKLIFPTKFVIWLTKYYRLKLMPQCIMSTIIMLYILSFLRQFSTSYQQAAIPLFIIQLINYGFFCIYTYKFFTAGSFRKNATGFMFSSYIAQILFFAIMYTTLAIIQPTSFIGIDPNDMKEPIQVFYDFLYFSSVLSGKVGFGDLYPKGALAKIIVTAQIFHSSLIVLIWFRGISFFIKVIEVSEFEQNYEKGRIKAMKELGQQDQYDEVGDTVDLISPTSSSRKHSLKNRKDNKIRGLSIASADFIRKSIEKERKSIEIERIDKESGLTEPVNFKQETEKEYLE